MDFAHLVCAFAFIALAVACAFMRRIPRRATDAWAPLCLFAALMGVSELAQAFSRGAPWLEQKTPIAEISAIIAGLCAIEFSRRALKAEGVLKALPWIAIPPLALAAATIHLGQGSNLKHLAWPLLLVPAFISAAAAVYAIGASEKSKEMKAAAACLGGAGVFGLMAATFGSHAEAGPFHETSLIFGFLPSVHLEVACVLAAWIALWRGYEKMAKARAEGAPQSFRLPALCAALAAIFLTALVVSELLSAKMQADVRKLTLEESAVMLAFLSPELEIQLTHGDKADSGLSRKLGALRDSHIYASQIKILEFDGGRMKEFSSSPGSENAEDGLHSCVTEIAKNWSPLMIGPYVSGKTYCLSAFVPIPLAMTGGRKMLFELRLDGDMYLAHLGMLRTIPLASALFASLVALAFFSIGRLNLEAREKLAASERAKEIARWGANVGVWSLKLDKKAIAVSRHLLEIAGYEGEGEEWPYEKWKELIPEDDLKDCAKKFNTLLAGDAPFFEAEHRLRGKDGRLLWVLSRGRVTLRDEAGKPVLAEGTIMDISALKDTEARLRTSMLRLETAQRLAKLGAWSRDMETGAIELSEESKRILGLPEGSRPKLEEILSMSHPEDAQRIWDEQARCVAEGIDLDVSYRIVRKDGKVRHIHSIGQIFRDANGKPLRLEGTILDVTDMKAAQEALKTSETAFRSLIENQSDVVMRLSPDWTILYASPSISIYKGLKPDEIVGKPLKSITPENASYVAFRDACFKSVFDSGKPLEKELQMETTQGPRVFNWRLFPEFGPGGKLTSVLSIARDITEHRDAELAFKNVFDNMLEGFLIGEMVEGWEEGGIPDFRITAVNPALERIAGRSAEQLLNMRISSFLEERDRPLLRNAMEVLKTGKPYHVSDFQSDNGMSLDITAYMAGPNKIAWIISDISARTRAEYELKSQMRLMQTIIDGIPDMLLLLRPDRTIIACNKAASSLMGWEQTPIELCECNSLLGLTKKCDDCAVEEVKRTRSPAIKNVESPDTGRSYEIRAMPLLDEKDGSLKMLVSLIRDTTEKNAMERDLDKVIDNLQSEILQRMSAEEALRRSEKLHRMLTEAVQVGIWQLDHDGRILYCNPRMREILELGQDERLEGKNSFDFFTECRIKPLEVAKDGQESFIHSYESETHGLKGARRNVLVSGIVLYKHGTKTLDTYIETFTDITEIRDAEREAESRKLKLMQAEKMASLGVLVSGVAHEINNPTNFIMLNAPILLDVWKSALPHLDKLTESGEDIPLAGMPYQEMRPLVPELFKSVFDGAERIKNIVAGLKEYARQDISDSLATTNVNDAVATSLVLLGNMIKKSTHRFKATYGDGIPQVKGSKQKIEQVILNLVQNACQALSDTEKELEIKTSFSEGKVKIVVSDEGCGIPKENMPFITDPFFTTKRDNGGTGLGLSITAGIVNELGGELTFESEQDVGTTATVSFPPFRQET